MEKNYVQRNEKKRSGRSKRGEKRKKYGRTTSREAKRREVDVVKEGKKGKSAEELRPKKRKEAKWT